MKITNASMSKTMICIAMVLLCACSRDKEGSPEPQTGDDKFYLLVNPRTGADYVGHTVLSLAEGDYNIANAVEGGMNWNYMWNINGTVYGLEKVDGNQCNLFKAALSEGGLLSATATLPVNLQGYLYDIGSDQLISIQSEQYIEANPAGSATANIHYNLMDAKTFTVTKTGVFPVQIIPNSAVWPNGIYAKEDKLYLSYIHVDGTTYESYPKAEALVINRSTLAVEKTITDTRSCSLGVDFLQGGFVLADDGALYISTSNTDYWGVNESLPAGVLRIKAGETDFDDSYFFDITAAVGGNHNIVLYPVGGGKALTKVFRKDLIVNYSDYWEGFVVEYWAVDVVSKTAQRLNIPLSRDCTWADFINIGNNKYAIISNGETGTYYYIYDAATGSVKQGAKYNGGNITWNIKFPK